MALQELAEQLRRYRLMRSPEIIRYTQPHVFINDGACSLF